MQSILNLFCIKYSSGIAKKRKYLLYFSIALLTEYIPTNIEMIHDKAIVKNVVVKVNNIYKQIKHNEVSPNTEYLFSNLDNENTFEESMKRMELMNTMMDGNFSL